MDTSQTISVPLKPGSRVTLLEDVEIEDEAEGSSGVIIFEDYVEQYVPEKGLLSFENSDVGRAELRRMVEEADGVEVLQE